MLKEAQPEESLSDREQDVAKDESSTLANDAVASEDSPLEDVAYVVLDEFHYMNDPSRGTVWEECCILSPPSIKLIALSATMTNAQQITSWLGHIHGPTALVRSEYRPVPLRYHYADNLGLVPMFTERTAGPGGAPDAPMTFRKRQRSWKLNPKLTPEGRAKRELDKLRRGCARALRR